MCNYYNQEAVGSAKPIRVIVSYLLDALARALQYFWSVTKIS